MYYGYSTCFAGCGGRGGDSNVDPTEAPDTNNEDSVDEGNSTGKRLS